MDVSRLSRHYSVVSLHEADADAILDIYRKNPLYFRHCEAEPTREQVLRDLNEAPPGIETRQKRFVGFFEGDSLVALLDLVEGYPEPATCYIGLFMVGADFQGKGVGRRIIGDACDWLRRCGFTHARLAIARDNPQANHFWTICGFAVTDAVERNGWPILVATLSL